jgi:acyl-CoA thioesterase
MQSTDLAKAVYHKMMETDYCTQWLGATPVFIKEGHCQLKMTVRKEMLNGHGILHGGIAFTFADSAFAFAANSFGRVAVSINSNMIFSKAAQLGETIFAEAKPLNITHKTADFDVDITNENGDIYYRFRGTVYRSSKNVIENG